MRLGIVLSILFAASSAMAQPAPAPPPAPYGPAPAPAPAPPPPYYAPPYQPPAPYQPPVVPPTTTRRSPWTWTVGLGVANLEYNEMKGPCPACTHPSTAFGLELSVGYRLFPELAAFAMVSFGLTSADGLGPDARGANINGGALILGGQLRLGERWHVLAGGGFGAVGYTWKETSSGLFGATEEERDLDVGRGPAALGGVRMQLVSAGKIELGLETTLMVMHMRKAGDASLLSVNLVAGWF